jgi:MFS family permease
MIGHFGKQLSEPARAFSAVFTNADLRRVELAFAGSEIGKWLYIIALAVFAYDAGGAAAVGLVALIRTVPAAVSAPFTALLADRYPRERVMLVATVIRVVAMVGATAVALADAHAAYVYVLAGIVTLASTAFRPAQAAVLPSLARTPEELTAANLASSTIATLAGFAAPAVGALLLAAGSVGVTFGATAAVFAASAVLVARVRPPEPPKAIEADRPRAAQGVVAEASAGFRAILGTPDLRLLIGLYAAQALVGGAFNVLVVVTALELLDLGEAGVGWLNTAFGIGGFLGAAVAFALLARRRLAADFMTGILLWGAPLVLIGVWPEPAVVLILLALVGVGETLVEVAGPTLLQRSVPDEVLARVFGALESLLIATIGIGGLLAPVLIELLGIRGALIVTGAVLPALAAIYWRRLTAVDRAHPAPERELDLLRTVPFLEPLPPGTLEQLASSASPVTIPAGDVVVRAGDRGDRFYLVVDGTVEVRTDDGGHSAIGPGGYFGEIALLRDVPRTATVRATSDLQLLALDRDEFIAAVTGHAPTAEAADAVVAARLGTLRPGSTG